MKKRERKIIEGSSSIEKMIGGMYKATYYFHIDKNKDISNLDTRIEVSYDVNISILDRKEKEYLKAVIKPFRDKVRYIIKVDCYNSSEKKEFIAIYITNDNTIKLPCFKKGTMYKRMEENKIYFLNDLEI